MIPTIFDLMPGLEEAQRKGRLNETGRGLASVGDLPDAMAAIYTKQSPQLSAHVRENLRHAILQWERNATKEDRAEFNKAMMRCLVARVGQKAASEMIVAALQRVESKKSKKEEVDNGIEKGQDSTVPV